MAAAVVADDAANVFRDGVQVADEVVDGFRGQIGVVGQRGIHVVDVGLVVLVVMQLHGLRVDERLEGGVVVRKRCKFVSHRGNLLSWDCTVSVEAHRMSCERIRVRLTTAEVGPNETIHSHSRAVPYVWMDADKSVGRVRSIRQKTETLGLVPTS